MKYETLRDGEWWRCGMKGASLMCCECSLVHVINFRRRGGQLEIQLIQDDRVTAAARRKRT